MPHNWRTTDDDEIERRRLRARTEDFRITNDDARHPIYSNFRVASRSGLTYSIEIRDVRSRQFGGLGEEARAALLDGAQALGCALAVEHRLPEPATLDAALTPPLTPAWGDALAPLRRFVADSSAPWSEFADVLQKKL